MSIQDAVAVVLIIVGALLMLLAAIGMVRLPDVLLRMSASSKAATLGVACVLLAVAEDFADVGVTSRALATIVFLMLTVPVGAHLIGRAAYLRGTTLWKGTWVDEIRGRYANDPAHSLSSDDEAQVDEQTG